MIRDKRVAEFLIKELKRISENIDTLEKVSPLLQDVLSTDNAVAKFLLLISSEKKYKLALTSAIIGVCPHDTRLATDSRVCTACNQKIIEG